MKRKAITIVVVLLSTWASAAPCPPRAIARLARASAVDRDLIKNYWKASIRSGSPVEEGALFALEAVDDVGRVAQILRTFPQADVVFGRIARLKGVPDRPGLAKTIRDLGSREANLINGASAELRYADEVLGAGNVTKFQLVIPNGVPDVVDAVGNLHEVKYRDWSRLPPIPAIWAGDLEGVVEQAENARQYAVARGKTYTLAFEIPVPSSHRSLFDGFFADFRGRPGVRILEGF